MAVPSVVHRDPPVKPGGAQEIPWRNAALERVDILSAEVSVTFATTVTQILRTIEGSGFMTGIWLDVSSSGGSGSSTSAVAVEDYPFSVLDSVVLSDVAGEVINLQGVKLWYANLAMHIGTTPTAGAEGTALTDTLSVGTTKSQGTEAFISNVGAAVSGGNFEFPIRIPVAVDNRTYLGALGNQDRSQRYFLRTNIAAQASVFSTSPSPTVPTITINKFYENRSVPMPTAPDGTPQGVLPPLYGTTHYLTQAQADAAPSASSTVQHFLQRVGNSIRFIVLEFRAAGSGSGSRDAAEDAPPTTLRLKLGETTVYNESWAYRKGVDFERYQFDQPNGVVTYDFVHDFGPFAGYSLNNDIIHSQALVNSRFEIAYSSGFTAGSVLTFVTSDLVYKQPEVAVVR